VSSLFTSFPDEVEQHADGWCGLPGRHVQRHLRTVAS
jgi:hypothetical protein